jgi:DNA-binding MarR family transcriptional regulator
MSSVRWLDDTEMRAWRNFIESITRLTAALEADLEPHGLTLGDYEVLAYLSDAPDRQMRMCDLAEALRLSASGLTRRLDGLTRTGVVERRACPSDRRVMLAALTPAGMRLLKKVAPEHVESVRRHLLDPLSRHEVEVLGEAFTKVRGALAASQTSPP